jgi:hypothetical protein
VGQSLGRVDGIDIQFEIVLEARFERESPTAADRVCGVATLTELDLATTHLLANSDRWADDGVLSRDLIDLAMMEPSRNVMRSAVKKACGPTVRASSAISRRRSSGCAIARVGSSNACALCGPPASRPPKPGRASGS